MAGDSTEVATQNILAPTARQAEGIPAEPKTKNIKTAPNPKRQKEARQRLDGLFSDRSNVWVIHYSC